MEIKALFEISTLTPKILLTIKEIFYVLCKRTLRSLRSLRSFMFFAK